MTRRKDDRYAYTVEEAMEKLNGWLDEDEPVIMLTREQALCICKAHGHDWKVIARSDKRVFYECRMCMETREEWT